MPEARIAAPDVKSFGSTGAVPAPITLVTTAFPAAAGTVPSHRRRTITMLAAAVGGYTALAIVLTYPLILHLSSRVPRDLQDSLWYVAALWWNAEVLPLSPRWWDGFSFFPAPGTAAFSDHMLGASLIATPLQWFGFPAIAAYNLTFLASFPLTSISAHVLALALTRRHDAAAVCGLAYGFSPYRIGHLEHLELLMAFGMPLALLAMHRYAATRRARWLVLLSGALAVQAISASYYALFFTVFVGLWLVWFVRPREWRVGLAIVAAGAAAALSVLPVALGYSRIHEHHHLSRDFADVLTYSADLTSFVTASAVSGLWGWTAWLNAGERQLFPGLTVVLLAAAGAVASLRATTARRDRLARVGWLCWTLGACLALVALSAWIAGPWRVEWGPLRASVSVVYKPLSVALALALCGIALTPAARAAFRRQSPFAFYLAAAVVLFLCSLGPRPTLLGEQVLYEPPYAWLMRLPFFADGSGPVPAVRVPARFAMLGILALSVAASLAFAKLPALRRGGLALAAIVLGGIAADAWPRQVPLPAPERGFRVPPDLPVAAILELPLGNTAADTAAMYRATLHGRPVVNGYHSFAPLSHHILRMALLDGDRTALDALASHGPLLIAVDRRADPQGLWTSLVTGYPWARRLSDDGHWILFAVERRPPPPTGCGSRPVIASTATNLDEDDSLAGILDGNPATGWATAGGQRAGDQVVIDLARVTPVCGIELFMGTQGGFYPRALGVDTSADGVLWEAVFTSRMGGPAFLAALENPRNSRLFVPFEPKTARYIRLRAERSDPMYPWTVADVVVRAWP